MDVIFLFTGVICVAESIMMFMGKDMMIFNDTTFKKEDYDMKRLSKVEGILFLVDGACCLGIGAVKMNVKVQLIFMGVVFITLLFHGRNFSGGRYKIKNK